MYEYFRRHCCNMMFPHTWQQMSDKMVYNMISGHQQAIWEGGNHIRAILYENVGLEGQIQAKDQETAALHRRHPGYLPNKDKKMV